MRFDGFECSRCGKRYEREQASAWRWHEQAAHALAVAVEGETLDRLASEPETPAVQGWLFGERAYTGRMAL